ncbi:MAG TPA: hypothetical protein VL128_00235 [Candidatus Eisenbacteria bacterium]|nr:hypothetical protein [Candidatus Eisenbacteria bacterium]
MLSLIEILERYTTLAKPFGEHVALSTFGLSVEETSKLFTALDEDYHISRFLRFSCLEGQRYLVDGEEVTHVALEPGIHDLL